MIDWDNWRAKYPELSWDHQLEFYAEVYLRHPRQSHFNSAALMDFFSIIRPRNVFELGGWDGEAAAMVLACVPQVERWLNVEICEPAVRGSICRDTRYDARCVDWKTLNLSGFDTAVLSHVVEHLPEADVGELLVALTDAQWLYIDAPLSEQGEDWHGYNGSHLFASGWSGLQSLVCAAGFVSLVEHGTIRTYAR